MTVAEGVNLQVLGKDEELAARLDAELTSFNQRATGATDEAALSVRVTDAAGELMAGLTGWSWGGCAGINMVWVRADRRGEGWGGRLLAAAEQEARRRGCTEVSVASFSFQAPGFYRRHGYLDTGRREGIPGGHVDHQFWKSLVSDPAAAVRLVALVELPDGAVEAGQRYEDTVLALLPRHGGRLERRLRTGDGGTEVHVIRFDTRAGYETYLADPERIALRLALGEAAPQTRVLEVHEV
ncbi:GNAT family N-acetyltransferase [Verrucosispora sp. WMMA2044]|uniref:GNAT family N-acetyltransferase n=1 Tax=Verrucosispora sioxanthis TaxID=2499994 RepID=A0A6M1L3C7_9ACTN|nr:MULTISPECIES: GNAT family N-acetyltransferase [Micromonospora]NEE63240.1 GNAT family N-acetyltransferase [Verrucosispora sioxanthis]NGM12350.1 GNAT family N-acetyltransferase [Verrucosispora sioxanthis]WBB47749.1 GNAT family N-acetyltransferase [Verrucosispora sp. WMMA2044]